MSLAKSLLLVTSVSYLVSCSGGSSKFGLSSEESSEGVMPFITASPKGAVINTTDVMTDPMSFKGTQSPPSYFLSSGGLDDVRDIFKAFAPAESSICLTKTLKSNSDSLPEDFFDGAEHVFTLDHNVIYFIKADIVNQTLKNLVFKVHSSSQNDELNYSLLSGAVNLTFSGLKSSFKLEGTLEDGKWVSKSFSDVYVETTSRVSRLSITQTAGSIDLRGSQKNNFSATQFPYIMKFDYVGTDLGSLAMRAGTNKNNNSVISAWSAAGASVSSPSSSQPHYTEVFNGVLSAPAISHIPPTWDGSAVEVIDLGADANLASELQSCLTQFTY